MKLQAVMENLQRQQRARLQQELEARQQQEQPPRPRSTPPPPVQPPPPVPGHNAALAAGASPLARSRSQDPALAEESTELESARMQRAQMAALAAMRAAAAGLSHSSSPGASDESQAEEEEEDEEERGEEDGDGGYQQDMGSEDDDDLKHKWDEGDFEEDLGEEEDEEEEEEEEEEDDYEEDEEMGEERLGSAEAVRAGQGSLLLRKPQAPQQYRGEPQRLPGGQDRLSSGLSHQGHSQLQQQAPDHGDWTYEEQFKQAATASPVGSEGWLRMAGVSRGPQRARRGTKRPSSLQQGGEAAASHEYPKPNETLRALPYHPSFPSSQAAAGSFQSLWSLQPCPHRVPLPRQPAAAPAKQSECVCTHVAKASSVRPLRWVGLEGAS
ncbi:PREDICTED: AT-rich interactive domain-containing protein 3A-like [Crocodylus porosus]|uniref:AT-rich interactive domain-containing protein 3A-like n=1 Tax=Crocodylus porosus TaxID=8502 RepID=UPI000939D8CB|nr:PREDICTED: AT-rich interactive domain-containing protein 3A-like [Crocodylus porosus]